MIILAFDTSTAILTAGLYANGKALAEFEETEFNKRSDTLVSRIAALLQTAGVPIQGIDAVAVGLGPGSFTGLRVGLASAKVITHILGKKIVGVPTQDAIARSLISHEGQAAVLLNAKKDFYYAALYNIKNGVIKRNWGPKIMSSREFLSSLRKPTLVVGDGAIALKRQCPEASGCVFGPEGVSYHPKASNVAAVAVERLAKRKTSDPKTLEPLYLYGRECNVTVKKK